VGTASMVALLSVGAFTLLNHSDFSVF